jgi:hypothetical protein
LSFASLRSRTEATTVHFFLKVATFALFFLSFFLLLSLLKLLWFGASGAKVVVPQFGGDSASRDAHALAVLQAQFPTRTVVGLEGARAILCGGGNVHCATQQQPTPRALGSRAEEAAVHDS